MRLPPACKAADATHVSRRHTPHAGTRLTACARHSLAEHTTNVCCSRFRSHVTVPHLPSKYRVFHALPSKTSRQALST